MEEIFYVKIPMGYWFIVWGKKIIIYVFRELLMLLYVSYIWALVRTLGKFLL